MILRHLNGTDNVVSLLVYGSGRGSKLSMNMKLRKAAGCSPSVPIYSVNPPTSISMMKRKGYGCAVLLMSQSQADSFHY